MTSSPAFGVALQRVDCAAFTTQCPYCIKIHAKKVPKGPMPPNHETAEVVAVLAELRAEQRKSGVESLIKQLDAKEDVSK